VSTRERASGQGRQVRVDERMGGAKVNEGACPRDGVCVREIGVCERDRCMRAMSSCERGARVRDVRVRRKTVLHSNGTLP